MLGDEVASVLPELQMYSESLMRDTVRIDELGEPVFNPETGATTRTVTQVYSGKGRVQSDLAPEPDDIAADAVIIQRFKCAVPLSVQGIKVGHRVTVIDSFDAGQDPELIGTPLTIRSIGHGTWVTSRRFLATEQQEA
jgi:hypothetical protein